MYQNLVTNECGEPMYYENVLDANEENEMYWEEMERRNDDPWYAASCEAESWYHRACDIFAENGVSVPDEVTHIFAKQLRKAQREKEERDALKEAQPALDFLNAHFPNTFEARYEPPTPIEDGYVEFLIKRGAMPPTKRDVADLEREAHELGIYIEDYVSYYDLRA